MLIIPAAVLHLPIFSKKQTVRQPHHLRSAQLHHDGYRYGTAHAPEPHGPHYHGLEVPEPVARPVNMTDAAGTAQLGFGCWPPSQHARSPRAC